MSSYHILYIFKFLSLMVYSGGFIGAFLTRSERDRRFAIHAVASPGLTAVWFVGFLLARELHYPLNSFFILASFFLSFLSLVIIMLAVSKQKHGIAPFALAASPMILVIYLMVTRPTNIF